MSLCAKIRYLLSVMMAWRTILAAALLLVVMTVMAYQPATQCGYVWDDDVWLTKNPLLTAPDGLWRIWFSTNSPSQYFPMVYTTFRFEYALWGFEPFGYHLTNIALHAINVLLLWWLLSQLGIPGAWLAAAIFALHPVHVESVAWITERKNVLMTFFFFLSLLAWMRFGDRSHLSRRAWPFYILSLLLYALALFSKTTACTLPAALVLSLWLKRIPFNAKRWLQIVPYVLLGMAMGMLAMWWEKYHQGTDPIALGLNPIERILIASHALWFYIGKLIWPVDLAFSYSRWKIDTTNLLQYGWLLACLIVTWSIWQGRDKLGRGPIAAITFFVATLSPMLGFLSLYTFFYTYVADHYQYVASIGPIALAAAVGYRIENRFFTGRRKDITTVVAILILATLGTLTWRQCHVYKNPETLWRDTLEKSPDSWMANHYMGAISKAQGKLDQAANYYRQTIVIKPNYVPGYNNLGNILLAQGRLDQAISCYRQAVRIKPVHREHALAHYNLGSALMAQGKLDEAISHFHQALQIKPNFADAHNNLGSILASQGKFDEAVSHFRHVLRIKPNLVPAHYNLGKVLGSQGNLDEAIKYLDEALRIKPDSVKVQNLRKTLLQQSKTE